MARDYAHSRSKNRGGAKRRRNRPPAKRNRRRNEGLPGWVWLFCGLCIGLAVAIGVYVFGRDAGGGIDIAGVPGPAQPPAGKEQPPAEKEDPEPRFAFYEMLPNYEVVIPEEEYVEPPTASHSDGGQATKATVNEPGRYVIQAGSFSTFDDADRRKASLALLGVESQIEQVTLDNGHTVYRVRTLPVDDLGQINDTLGKLHQEGIDTLVMRYRD